MKNVHPVYGAGIRIHNLWNMSLLPYPSSYNDMEIINDFYLSGIGKTTEDFSSRSKGPASIENLFMKNRHI